MGYANGITHDPKDAKSILRLVNKNPSIEAHELKGFYLAENKYQKYLEKHPEINSNIKIKMNQSDNYNSAFISGNKTGYERRSIQRKIC